MCFGEEREEKGISDRNIFSIERLKNELKGKGVFEKLSFEQARSTFREIQNREVGDRNGYMLDKYAGEF